MGRKRRTDSTDGAWSGGWRTQEAAVPGRASLEVCPRPLSREVQEATGKGAGERKLETEVPGETLIAWVWTEQ